MLKKILLATVALGTLAGSALAQDVKVLRIGLDGSENEADQIRNTECVGPRASRLPSASTRSRYSPRRTIMA